MSHSKRPATGHAPAEMGALEDLLQRWLDVSKNEYQDAVLYKLRRETELALGLRKGGLHGPDGN